MGVSTETIVRGRVLLGISADLYMEEKRVTKTPTRMPWLSVSGESIHFPGRENT